MSADVASHSTDDLPRYPQVSTLSIKFLDQFKILEPGQLVPLNTTKQTPEVQAPITLDDRAKYVLIVVDWDGRINQTIPTKTLHLYQSSLTMGSDRILQAPQGDTQCAAYAAPAPPPGQVHRYTVVLYQQPDNYSLPEEFVDMLPLTREARYNFQLEKFAEAAKLGEVVAGNFFRVAA